MPLGCLHVVVDTPSSHKLRVRPYLYHNPVTASTDVFQGPIKVTACAHLSTWIIQTQNHIQITNVALGPTQTRGTLFLEESVRGTERQLLIPYHQAKATYLSTTILSQRWTVDRRCATKTLVRPCASSCTEHPKNVEGCTSKQAPCRQICVQSNCMLHECEC